jgi:2-phospho-L-lactate guanylyltransferase
MKVTAIVPIKSWRTAKSRLGVDDALRSALAEAFAKDVLVCLAESDSVARTLVVTSDRSAAAMAMALGAESHIPRTFEGFDPLIRAVDQGVAWSVAHHPGDGVMVVPSDLPSMGPTDVDWAVAKTPASGMAFCPDLEESGTTVLIAAHAHELAASYGPDSALVHRRRGARVLTDATVRLRRDVDTSAHLREALHLGVGPHTAEVWRAWCQQVSSRILMHH